MGSSRYSEEDKWFFYFAHLLNVGFYLGFFEFVHNVRKRGKALLGALIELLVT
jgi:hypothetical protein